MDDAALAALAAGQHGVFTRRQAATLGYSAYQIRRRIADGRWQEFGGGVLAEGVRRRTAGLREAAALLASPGAVLAGPTAARRHGWDCPDRRIFVAAGSTGCVAITGVVRLPGPVPVADVVRHGGCPTTSMGRTLVDCCLVLAAGPALDLLTAALRSELVTLAELAPRVHAHAGRRGAPRLARLMRAARQATA
ncbi:MAG: hypothetical protein HOV79_15715 [Hamadaea sp.]|nr:hypothetical protein [Hamadaea sp.]